jgi:ribosomal protein S18 acetylase RimI-like enzyme
MMIRPATAPDLPAIAALHAANWRHDYAGILPAAALEGPLAAFMAARWGKGALDRAMAVLVARGVPGLLGFVAFDPTDAQAVHVDAIHVAAGHRGFGVGAALLGAVARLAGARAIWLEVLEGNAVARAVYAKWAGGEGPVFHDRLLGEPVTVRRVTWADSAALADRLGAEAPR